MIDVQFVTLSGKFAFTNKSKFDSLDEAKKAVEAYATAQGYSNVKIVDSEDGIRFTATTPNGRNGRNVAFGDEYRNEDEDFIY